MPTIQEQLDTLKRTLAAILDGIERLELQLDTPPQDEHDESCTCSDCNVNRIRFNLWADTFDARWKAANGHPCDDPLCTICGGSGQVYVMDDGDGNGHLEPCECRISHSTGDLPCGNVLCPECGDVRDTSAVR